LVSLAVAVAGLSAFAASGVRTAEYKYGQMSTYGLDVHVWGVRFHREIVHGTLATLHAQALVREHQWRSELETTSALAGAAAVLMIVASVTWGGRRDQE
jgi:hypothetical protein